MPERSDVGYWTQYYKSGAAPEEPSLFAQHVIGNYVQPGESLIELGCGNGRDARFFASNGVDVVAIDQCAPEIEELIRTNGKHENLHYQVGDFTQLPEDVGNLDVVYSRFTLHSVDAAGQHRTLEWAHRNLTDKGRLCIETRGQKNELYKKGISVEGEQDAYIFDSHYRRFVNFEEFTEEIRQIGFTALQAAEKTGFAPFGDTDYHFIRIIAQK